jgi:hypothetical protein
MKRVLYMMNTMVRESGSIPDVFTIIPGKGIKVL